MVKHTLIEAPVAGLVLEGGPLVSSRRILEERTETIRSIQKLERVGQNKTQDSDDEYSRALVLEASLCEGYSGFAVGAIFFGIPNHARITDFSEYARQFNISLSNRVKEGLNRGILNIGGRYNDVRGVSTRLDLLKTGDLTMENILEPHPIWESVSGNNRQALIDYYEAVKGEVDRRFSGKPVMGVYIPEELWHYGNAVPLVLGRISDGSTITPFYSQERAKVISAEDSRRALEKPIVLNP